MGDPVPPFVPPLHTHTHTHAHTHALYILNPRPRPALRCQRCPPTGQVAYNVEMSGLGKASMAFGIIAWCCFCFLVIISFLFNTNDSTTSTPSSALYCL